MMSSTRHGLRKLRFLTIANTEAHTGANYRACVSRSSSFGRNTRRARGPCARATTRSASTWPTTSSKPSSSSPMWHIAEHAEAIAPMDVSASAPARLRMFPEPPLRPWRGQHQPFLTGADAETRSLDPTSKRAQKGPTVCRFAPRPFALR